MVSLDAEEEGGWTGGRGGAFPEPMYICRVIGAGPECLLAHVSGVGHYVVVCNVSAQLELAVVDGSRWIIERDQVAADDGRKGRTPEVRSEVGAVANGHKEDAAHSGACGVASSDYVRGTGDEFGDSCGAGGNVGGHPPKVI